MRSSKGGIPLKMPRNRLFRDFHAPLAQFPLDPVAVGQGSGEAIQIRAALLATRLANAGDQEGDPSADS